MIGSKATRLSKVWNKNEKRKQWLYKNVIEACEVVWSAW